MSLRIRQSLVWETRKPISGTYYDSPAFILMNSRWRLELRYPLLSNEKHPIYEISMRYCGYPVAKQFFSPFEVKVFFEDRRKNVQMHLSNLIVSSRHEILCRTSLNSIHKKLPGLALYDDINVVCIFTPSTGLKLHLMRENGSCLKVRESLVWETKKPSSRDYESPVFTLNKASWKLWIKRDVSHDVPLYQISIKKCSENHSFQSFDVSTLIEDRRNDVEMYCSKLTITSASETLCRTTCERIYEKLPRIKHSDDITIVCIFSPSTELSLCVKTETDMEKTSKDFQSRKRSSFSLHNTGTNTSSKRSKSLKFSPDMKSLSDDFCHLLDKKIMADLLLKSGDEIIPVHKLILAARSDVFSAMFQHDMNESKSGIVAIQDIEPFVLRPFLKYIYSGKLPDHLSEEMTYELYSVSDKYAVSTLRKSCSTCLISYLNNDNFIKILMLADAHSDAKLKNAVADYIIHRPSLMTDGVWKRFSENCPKLSNEIYQKIVAEKPTK